MNTLLRKTTVNIIKGQRSISTQQIFGTNSERTRFWYKAKPMVFLLTLGSCTLQLQWSKDQYNQYKTDIETKMNLLKDRIQAVRKELGMKKDLELNIGLDDKENILHTSTLDLADLLPKSNTESTTTNAEIKGPKPTSKGHFL